MGRAGRKRKYKSSPVVDDHQQHYQPASSLSPHPSDVKKLRYQQQSPSPSSKHNKSSKKERGRSREKKEKRSKESTSSKIKKIQHEQSYSPQGMDEKRRKRSDSMSPYARDISSNDDFDGEYQSSKKLIKTEIKDEFAKKSYPSKADKKQKI